MVHKYKVGDYVIINTLNSRHSHTADFDRWYHSKEPQRVTQITSSGVLLVDAAYDGEEPGMAWMISAREVLPAKGHKKPKRINSWLIESIK